MLDTSLLCVEACRSDSVIVHQNGEVVFDHRSRVVPAPIELMSVTKSIVSLLTCKLVDLGLLPSLDVPVGEFYREWSQGPKERVTLRHVLTHTSCLRADRTTEEIYGSGDFVQLALNSDLIAEPGSRFFYNNKAVNLLPGILYRVSGETIDRFAENSLFGPLGISEFSWERDRSGNPHAMAGVSLNGDDLLKIGLLILNQGKINDVRVLSPKIIEESVRPGQQINESCGLLWWRLYDRSEFFFDFPLLQDYVANGIDSKFISGLESVLERRFPVSDFHSTISAALGGKASADQFIREVYRAQLPLRRHKFGKCLGYKASGYLGQELVILPDYSVVGVRQIHWTTAERVGRGREDFSTILLRSLGLGYL